jgi:hypothetical protein
VINQTFRSLLAVRSRRFPANTCGAKQPFFWQILLKKALNCAAGIARAQRTITLIVISAIALATAGCAAAAPPDKDGKPMAGVHTLAWRTGRTMGISLSWTQSPPYSCTSEHYALSDANGEFVIPTSVIDRPFFASSSSLSVTAFSPGMKPESVVISGEEKRVPGSDYERDFYPTTEKPLVIEVRLLPDSREHRERALDIDTKAQNQGCSCTDFNRALITESLKMRDEYYQAERAKGNIGQGGERFFLRCNVRA